MGLPVLRFKADHSCNSQGFRRCCYSIVSKMSAMDTSIHACLANFLLNSESRCRLGFGMLRIIILNCSVRRSLLPLFLMAETPVGDLALHLLITWPSGL